MSTRILKKRVPAEQLPQFALWFLGTAEEAKQELQLNLIYLSEVCLGTANGVTDGEYFASYENWPRADHEYWPLRGFRMRSGRTFEWVHWTDGVKTSLNASFAKGSQKIVELRFYGPKEAFTKESFAGFFALAGWRT